MVKIITFKKIMQELWPGDILDLGDGTLKINDVKISGDSEGNQETVVIGNFTPAADPGLLSGDESLPGPEVAAGDNPTPAKNAIGKTLH